MPKCFICSLTCPTVRSLFIHFGYMHQTESLHQYICVEEGCDRKFDSKQSYSRHFRLSHSQSKTARSLSSSFKTTCTEDLVELGNSQIMEVASNSLATKAGVGEKEFPLFIASLYANPRLPRNCINSVVQGFTSHISGGVAHMVGQCLSELNDTGSITCNNIGSVYEVVSHKLESSFESFDSDYKRMQYFEEVTKTFVKPLQIVIGQRIDARTNDGRVLEPVTCTEQVIPLHIVLQKFFSITGVFEDTVEYMAALQLQNDIGSGIIQNFIQASFWQSQKIIHGNRTVIPLFLFFDDFETGNVLSSHAGIHKLGAVYVSIPCLPPKWASQLSNIFLAALFHSSDRVAFGNNVIFTPVMNEINFLYNSGIELDICNEKVKRYFQLGALVGDNLGIHSITGFTESFSANYPCRICNVEKSILKTQCYEDETALRTLDVYNEQIRSGLLRDATGIKEKCVWLNIQGFSLFDQVAVDMMHDVLEGCAKYILSFLIVRYVTEQSLFSLDVLNSRIFAFNFGPDHKSKPMPLNMQHLKQGNVRLTASEMIAFVRYFGLLIGDFIPSNDPAWQLQITLRRIMDILLSTSFNLSLCESLQVHIAEMNEQYLLFSKQPLKPKFHHLTHYHRIIKTLGPPSKMWCMRFEAKHRVFKHFSNSSCNRRNSCLTLAVRHQLQLNYLFLKGHQDKRVQLGPEKLIKNIATVLDETNFTENDNLMSVSWVEINGLEYRGSTILLYDIPQDEDPILMQINNIYVYGTDKRIIFECSKFLTIGFDEHYFAYEVLLPEQKEFFYRSLDVILSTAPVVHHLINVPNGKDYIICRDYI